MEISALFCGATLLNLLLKANFWNMTLLIGCSEQELVEYVLRLFNLRFNGVYDLAVEFANEIPRTA